VFDGTLLFVSHDRYFINKIADKIITMDRGIFKVYDGDYSNYLEECQKESMKEREDVLINADRTFDKPAHSAASEVKELIKVSAKKTAAADQERMLKLLEASIDELEVTLRKLEEEMKLHNTEADYLKDLFTEKENTEEKLNKAYELWESRQLECSLK
jgi:ATPase subunit of ABC transporter with duplicated ATPase domains